MPPSAPSSRLRAAGIIGLVAALPVQAFDLEGHRGTRGLMPENTLAAFNRAIEIGVNTLETDLAVTKDGVLVISHDPFLNPDVVRGPDGRWLGGQGPADPLADVRRAKRYDIGRLDPASKYATQFPQQQSVDGQRFPTLGRGDCALRRPRRSPCGSTSRPRSRRPAPTRPSTPATFARLVVEAIRSARMTSRTTIQSFDWRTLVEAKRLAPEIETACLTIETPNFDTVQSKSEKPSPWLAGLDLRKRTARCRAS